MISDLRNNTLYPLTFLILGLLLTYTSCGTNIERPSDPNDPSLLDWLIPRGSIIDRGADSDSISSIDNPSFLFSGQVTLDDSDLVLGVNVLGEQRAYPEKILDYHEIVNDVIRTKKVAVTYCPLTGTALAWETTDIQSISPIFSATTYVYNSNNILFDEQSNSYWQQMYSRCVAGNFSGQTLDNFGIVETTWANWKYMFPGARVLGPPAGSKFNYDVNPYKGYTDTDSLYFTTSPVDKRLPLKERMLGLVIGGHAKVYRFSDFADSVSLVQDNFQGLSVVLAGSNSRNFIVCYERRTPDSSELSFSVNTDAGNIIMVDNEGTKWDIFGNGVDGPRRGQHLNITHSMMGYWFAFGAMYPDALIYNP